MKRRSTVAVVFAGVMVLAACSPGGEQAQPEQTPLPVAADGVATTAATPDAPEGSSSAPSDTTVESPETSAPTASTTSPPGSSSSSSSSSAQTDSFDPNTRLEELPSDVELTQQPLSPVPVTAPPPADPTNPGGSADLFSTMAATQQLSWFSASLAAAGLDTTLAAGPHTLFAVSDAAIAALPVQALAALEDPATLRRVLLTHIAASRVFSSQLTATTPVASLSGELLVFGADTAALFVGTQGRPAGRVVAADLSSSTSVVHIIDVLLVPTDLLLPGVVAPTPPTTVPTTLAPLFP